MWDYGSPLPTVELVCVVNMVSVEAEVGCYCEYNNSLCSPASNLSSSTFKISLLFPLQRRAALILLHMATVARIEDFGGRRSPAQMRASEDKSRKYCMEQDTCNLKGPHLFHSDVVIANETPCWKKCDDSAQTRYTVVHTQPCHFVDFPPSSVGMPFTYLILICF